MLDSIRKISKGPIGWIIFIIIFIPFALFGIQSYFVDSTDSVAIRVGDESISNFEFNNIWQRQLRQIQLENLPNQMEEVYRLNLIQGLIARLAIQNHLNQENFVIEDQFLGKTIASNPIFFENGQFSKKRYIELLNQNQIQIENYEKSIKDDLKNEQFNQFLTHALFLTSSEVIQTTQLFKQKRSGGYRIYDAMNLVNEYEISDQEAQEKYIESKSNFKTAERVKLDYVLIDKNQINSALVSESEIEKYYQNWEAREVREIFISDAGNFAKKEQLANELLKKINTNEASFDELISYSDDPNATKNNGRLGLVEKGGLGKHFEELIFSLNEKEVGLYKSDVGFHLLLVEKIFNYKETPLTKLRDLIESILLNKKKELEYKNLVYQAQDINYDVIDNLDSLSDTLNLEIQTSEFIELNHKSDNELFNQANLLEVAFSEALKSGANSDVIELNNDQTIIFRQKEFIESREKTFEEAKEEIIQLLKVEKAVVELNREINEKFTLLDSESVDNLFENWVGYESLDIEAINKLNIAPEIVQTAFNLSNPLDGKLSFKTVMMPNNRVAAVWLSKVELVDEKEITEREIMTTDNILKNVFTQTLFHQITKHLNNESEVFIAKDVLE